MARRIGPILIAVGVAIFVYQAAALYSERAQRASRVDVLTGSIEQMAGTREVRPALSVVGVVCVAGGIFVMALGGGKRR